MNSIVSYEEQLYLLGYWLRTNIIGFKLDRDLIAKELYQEFEIEDENVINDLMKMLEEAMK